MKKIEIKFTSVSEAYEFANRLNESSNDDFSLTNEDGSKTVDLRTHMSIIYALSDFDKIYLINNTNDGVFPEFIRDVTSLYS